MYQPLGDEVMQEDEDDLSEEVYFQEKTRTTCSGTDLCRLNRFCKRTLEHICYVNYIAYTLVILYYSLVLFSILFTVSIHLSLSS